MSAARFPWQYQVLKIKNLLLQLLAKIVAAVLVTIAILVMITAVDVAVEMIATAVIVRIEMIVHVVACVMIEMIETIKANPGIILVTLGPLTNVALALGRAPEIVANVSRCVVMGGAANVVGAARGTPAFGFPWTDDLACRGALARGLTGISTSHG